MHLAKISVPKISIAIAAMFLGNSLAQAQSAEYQKGVSDYNAGRYAAAQSELKNCKKSYPTNVLVHYYLALTDQALNHLDEAKEEYQWVAANGDARMKAMSSLALKQLSGVHTSASSAPLIASSSRPTSSQPANKKVSKILEFSADW